MTSNNLVRRELLLGLFSLVALLPVSLFADTQKATSPFCTSVSLTDSGIQIKMLERCPAVANTLSSSQPFEDARSSEERRRAMEVNASFERSIVERIASKASYAVEAPSRSIIPSDSPVERFENDPSESERATTDEY